MVTTIKTMQRHYLDWASTSIPDSDIIRRMTELSTTVYGNPSSKHQSGKEAASILQNSRRKCAELLGCTPEEIIYTSGGTESNNMVLFSLLMRKQVNGLVISGVEHPSVFYPAKRLKEMGIPVTILEAENSGHINIEKLSEAITHETAMVSVMTVNNETGAVQPIDDVAEVLREKANEFGHPIHFHSDGVQALGKIPFTLKELKVDSMSFSAHKIQGPKCAGLLYLKKQLPLLYCGGEQEGKQRPGTECIGGIFGFTLAIEKALSNLDYYNQHAKMLITLLIKETEKIPGALINSHFGEREYSPFIFNASFPGIPGEVLVRVLSDRGFDISTGSACSSTKKDKTRVLKSMGRSEEEAFSAVRVSLGPLTTEEEMLQFSKTLASTVQELQRAI
jgi:cysteine desulfurase